MKRQLTSLSVMALLLFTIGCRTVTLPPVNTAQPGWTLQQGQALWRTDADAPEIAGEVLLARDNRGQTLLQFTKNPLPFVTVQTSNDLWRIEFVPQKREFSGRGRPTPRLIWVHLARALNGDTVGSPFRFQRGTDGAWLMENVKTGEKVEGFL